MPLLDTIGKIFGGSAGDLVTSIGNVADKFITTKQEKEEFAQQVAAEINRHDEAVRAGYQKELEAQLADIANARTANIAIQSTEKASWLSKNVAYFIDAFVTILWGGLAVYIAARFLNIIQYIEGEQPNLTVILAFWAGISTQFGTILNFHRGSSVQSRVKDDTIKNLTQ